MDGRPHSDRPKKLPSRFVGGYGLRMVTTSREKTLKPALTTTARRGRTADVRELSAVLQCDLQNTFPPDRRMDGDYQNAAPPADYRSAVPPDKATHERQ